MERGEHDLGADRFLPRQRRRKLNGVVAAKRAIPRQSFSTCDERFGHGNPREVGPVPRERAPGFASILLRQETDACCPGERRGDLDTAEGLRR